MVGSAVAFAGDGASLGEEGCGGKGGVCAQALTLSEETRKDVDASRCARNRMTAPCDQRGGKRDNAVTPLSPMQRNLGDVRVSPNSPCGPR